jgi:hypothetical protein
MKIERTEVETGGPMRTPRTEIVPLMPGIAENEPEGYWDVSGSTGWEVAPPEGSSPTRYKVMSDAIRGFIIPFEKLDSQAAREQADGDGEKGGVYFYPFNHAFCPIGDGDDDGDLNSSNFEEKMAKFERDHFSNGAPQGGTEIMQAIRAGDRHYMGEFGPGGENPRPREARPVRMRTVWTDGELKDVKEFARYMEDSTIKGGLGVRKDWDEVWAVAIFGYGDAHDQTLRQYQDLAKRHPNIHVYSFDQVRNGDEVAEDMAIAAAPGQS